MSESKIETVAVLGAGLMGTGIAQVVATGGYNVHLRDISQDILDKSKASINKRLNRLVEKEKMTQKTVTDVLERITLLKSGVGNMAIDSSPQKQCLNWFKRAILGKRPVKGPTTTNPGKIKRIGILCQVWKSL